MEVSLAALVGNLLARWARILASVLLYFPILKCMAKILLILVHKNQPGMQTHYLRHHESPAEVNALSAVKRQLEDRAGSTLLGSLCWFSSRQDKQRAIDLRKSFSQAREPWSCVMRWPPRAGPSHQAFCPLAQTPLSGPHVHRFQSCNCSNGCIVKYWSMQRLIVILGATLFLEIFTFTPSISSPPKPFHNSLHCHLLEPGPAASAVPSSYFCRSSLWKSTCFPLWKAQKKKGGN